MSTPPYISVIIPVYNEAHYITRCIESLVESCNHTCREYEILILDGMSTDNTRSLIDASRMSNARIQILDNKQRDIPSALNIGITCARGSIVFRADAHSVYPINYIGKLAAHLEQNSSWSVIGGKWNTRPRSNTITAQAIALTYSSPLGSGLSKYRTRNSKHKDMIPMQVDVVPFGAFRASVFRDVGLYNTNLARSEDVDMFYRIKKAGLQIVMDPQIEIDYFVRSDFPSFFRHAFLNGVWVAKPLAHIPFWVFQFRHFAPFLLTQYILFIAVLSVILNSFLPIVGTLVYIIPLLVSSVKSANFKPILSLYCIVAYMGLHLAYGFGTLYGLLMCFPAIITRQFKFICANN